MATTSKILLQSRNLPWVEKYRPQTLDDLISHKNILSTIQKFISEDKLPHLFYGPPGTGKSSTILGTAKQLDKDNEFNAMVLEGFKLVILDEADAMTRDAQNALRRVIEKYIENTHSA
ncbi:replication factor C subunit 5-like isoform X2 [Oncorhynchus masou masou]|uniref:replication factor C subunit 5-like isoform X2 n=1 Tax=Oncorhynchus masou masou TaxID=90313 RepID=UPI00318320D1